ncbi:MAG: sigma 54-interacting transcriptional regulator [Candidatus Sulfotelmatobacter sp.]
MNLPSPQGVAMDLHPGREQRQVLEAKPDELRRVRRSRENQEWYEDLVEHSHDLLCVHDLEGHLLLVNPAPARILGYSVEELLSIPMRELIPLEFRSQFDSYLSQIEMKGEARGFLALMTRSGERRIWQYYNTLRIDGAEGRRIVRGIAHDVTEQLRTEKLLREAGEGLLREVRKNERTIAELKLFRTLVDQSNDAIEVVDPETLRFLDVSEKACSALGYSREEMLSLRVHDIHPATSPLSLEKIREDLHKFGFFVLECQHQRKDGSVFPVEVSMRWVHLDRDYIVAVARDLTERNQAAERLREYERVVEGLEEMIVVVDRDYRYVIANQAFLKYRDMKKEEVLGRRVDEVVHKEVFESLVRGKMEECFRDGKVVAYDMKYAYPTLGERELFATYFPIEGPTGVERIAVILQDVTEPERAERALKESEEKFSKAFRQGPMAITITSIRDGRYIEVNETFERATGWHREEVLGRTPLDIELWVNPGERLELGARLLREGRIRNVETAFRMKNGSIRAVSITAERIEVNGEPCVIGAAVDISEQQKAEKALRENVAQLQSVTEELRLAKEKLAEEKLYLEQAIDTELGFGEIIGRSTALKEVMEKVAKVAPSDATVLLLGETGTGKELVARAIHRLSNRKDNSFIKLNCAAIPSGLLESELFGHEKGAFTGAVAKKLGRLELADKGTLFLDEIGEVSLDLQPKLLRVLQDQEFERLGSTQTLKVNFRLIAATNRDLLESVNRREFRTDLYYRLNVFPLRTPPLRERREDIPLLIEHFVRKYAGRMNKSIRSIPAKTMETLMQWGWPGNIRELENFVERSVILTPGSVLQVPLNELHADIGGGESETLHDAERERILRALRECNGQLGGPNGAAARLGLKRTTLQSKLNAFGINPGGYRA